MGKYFVRDTPLAGLEQEMMQPPNFTPRGSSSAILCGYSPHGAGVDCQSCFDHRRQSSRTLACLHITERLQAGAVTISVHQRRCPDAEVHLLQLQGPGWHDQ